MNLEFNRNEDWMKLSISKTKQYIDIIKLGGGKKAIEKQHERNKLTPRERIDFLIDKGTCFTEIGTFAGFEMYEEQVKEIYGRQ